MTVTRNRCLCRVCWTVIESKRRHDFQRCKCGAIFTDGGLDYIRRGATDFSILEDVGDREVVFKADGTAEVLP